jgi:hypothetical protein
VQKNGKMKSMNFDALTVEFFLHRFDDPPDQIKSLVDNFHPLSKHFFDNSRLYNTQFQTKSFGTNEIA